MTKFLHCLSALQWMIVDAIFTENAYAHVSAYVYARLRDLHVIHMAPPPRRRQHGIHNVLLSHPYGMDVVYLKMRLLKMQIFHILLPHNIYATAGWNAWAPATIYSVLHIQLLAHTTLVRRRRHLVRAHNGTGKEEEE